MGQINDMYLPLQQDELIDRYLRNQMSKEEECDFENMLRTAPDLRKRARFIAQTIQELKNLDKEGQMSVPESGYRMVARNPLAKSKKKE